VKAEPLDAATLQRLLEEHNRRELIWAGVIGAASLVLWIASYALVAVFVVLISVLFSAYPHTWLVHSVTAAVMLVLIWDAVHYSGELFDLKRFRESFYSIGAGRLNVSMSSLGVSVTRGNPLQAAWGLSQFLLCAPRGTLSAIRHLGNRATIDEARLNDAVHCFRRLEGTPDWMGVNSLGAHASGLRYLDLTGMLWTRVSDGLAEVKLDPTARSQYAAPSARVARR
jgi:hypothetical protein